MVFTANLQIYFEEKYILAEMNLLLAVQFNAPCL